MLVRQTPVVNDVVQQFSDEISFQWGLRKNAQKASNYLLEDLVQLEERLAANIDGVVIYNETGWQCCLENLEILEPGEIFTAGVVAAELKDMEKINYVFDLAGDNPKLLDAIVDALVWFPIEHCATIINSLFESEVATKRHVAITALKEYRSLSSSLERDLLDMKKTGDLAILRLMLDTFGQINAQKGLPSTIECLEHDDECVKFSASWAAARGGNAKGMNYLKQVLDITAYSDKALHFVTMQVDSADTVALIKNLFKRKETQRVALNALGYFGDPRSIPQLIEFMQEPELARGAGEAFTNITGINLEESKLDAEWPEGFEAGPTENPEDEDVDMDPDDDLPWPDAQKITAWWEKNKSRFEHGKLYFVGMGKKKATFEHVLRHGNQKQRAYAANALGLYEKDKPIFNVYAPAKRQMQLLGMN